MAGASLCMAEAGTGIKLGGRNTRVTFVFLSSGPNKHPQEIMSIHQMLIEGKLWPTQHHRP